MEIISEQNLDIINRAISNMTDEEVEEVGKQFAEEQPYLMLYTLLNGSKLTENEQADLLILAIRLWYCFAKLSQEQIKTIEVEEIDEIQGNNERMADYFADEDEPDFTKNMETMLEHYPQKFLLKYLVLEILGEGVLSLKLSTEAQGIFFMIHKVIIECLNKNT